MAGKLRPWRQQIKQSRVAIGFVAVVGSGTHEKSSPVIRAEGDQPGKTLWDWLQLLIAPAVLLLFGWWFTRRQQLRERKREELQREIALDTQREAALQAYIDTMSDLLLHEKLRDSAEEDEVRKIARVRTLTILARLDAHRKRSVLQFLDESGLIERGESIVNVRGADLSGVDLKDAPDTTPEPLEKVKSLQNATMPDGSTHAWQATL